MLLSSDSVLPLGEFAGCVAQIVLVLGDSPGSVVLAVSGQELVDVVSIEEVAGEPGCDVADPEPGRGGHWLPPIVSATRGDPSVPRAG